MAREIRVGPFRTLDEHAEHAMLAQSVQQLRRTAGRVAGSLRGRTLWMINSTAQGGGVSEMLPGLVSHLNELGIRTRWLVIETEDERFFRLTKRLHNMIHGEGRPGLGEADREIYEATNRANADAILGLVRDGDILAVHDPQPLPIMAMLSHDVELVGIWRCHIGLDEDNEATDAAWRFLQPYAEAYDHAIFSAPEYVVPYLEGRCSIIYPALDPLSQKNRPLHVSDVVAVLQRSGLLRGPAPRVRPRDPVLTQRLQHDGSFGAATTPDDIGLLTRPIITQVSRWDRLKGFLPLMLGFARLKQELQESPPADGVLRRRLQLARLVLAGPDPGSVSDDPEGRGVLDELRHTYVQLPEPVRADIALVALPMDDAARNGLIVNALQRVSTIVVQNSLREGFGLTITEALWKALPVLSNSVACGPRQQVRGDIDGCMLRDPTDAASIAHTLAFMLAEPARLHRWGRSGQRRAHEHFLIYTQLRHWLRLLDSLVAAGRH